MALVVILLFIRIRVTYLVIYVRASKLLSFCINTLMNKRYYHYYYLERKTKEKTKHHYLLENSTKEM